MQIDQTDTRLLTALKQDARASVTTLAATLNLTRTTVQKRMERLERDGIIARYTIEVGEGSGPPPVRAVMLIALQGAMGRKIIRRLHDIPAITSVYSTNGKWDLVANIEAESLPAFDRILRDVREIEGVTNSETCLLLDEA
ncbi:Lrp/AsnC family transcriptional regulator [Nereida sp. MMG025]|uniref:Lrp/AsnC family transcriptional regulator n=1 Tax=Nereida sp. MMG025 TaxID=2909981 RepID=UPI001F3DE4B8|nr:Lrp/AsnC family transcriptional regulator [Nereida sp. MMG025]MCF6444876.1 Lrp/AsnC family transcriptional regulator [Nereida sp. MMG025]